MKEIIKSLASKELSFGCRVQCKDGVRTIVANKTKNQWWLQEENNYQERFKKYLVKTEEGSFGLGDGEYADYEGIIEILGHPIYKHHIEALFKKESTDEKGYVTPGTPNLKATLLRLFDLWFECGITRSLQQIEAKSGYEVIETPAKRGDVDNGYDDPDFHKQFVRKEKRLKDPKARALAEFIKTII